jgi:hypothetical protein
MLKYSRNTSPKEILLGQAEESHTGEQLLQISATMMGWARRLKNRDEEQQEHRFELGVEIFWEREGAREEEISEKPGGAPSQQVGAARAGPRPLCVW